MPDLGVKTPLEAVNGNADEYYGESLYFHVYLISRPTHFGFIHDYKCSQRTVGTESMINSPKFWCITVSCWCFDSLGTFLILKLCNPNDTNVKLEVLQSLYQGI